MSSNTGHGVVSFFETDPARVDVLQAQYDQEEEVKMSEILGQQQTRKRRRMILCM